MPNSLFFLLFSLIGLFISAVYEHYSKDHQLFIMHQIPRGHLSITQKFNTKIQSSLNNISQSLHSLNILLQIDVNNQTLSVQKFNLIVNEANIFQTFGENFISVLSGRGEIQAHGDSFYKIKDFHDSYCYDQKINDIVFENKTLTIVGHFDGCKNLEYKMIIHIVNQRQLSISLSTYKSDLSSNNRVVVYFTHNQNSNYFGLGQQFSYLNLGHDRPFSLFVREKGVARTEQPETSMINWLYGAAGSYYYTYAPAPIWIAIQEKKRQKQNYEVQSIGYIYEGYEYCIWMNNHLLVWNTNPSFSIVFGRTVKQTLSQISIKNGYTPPIPDWINQGAIIGLQGGTKSVMQKYNKLKNAGAKISSLWLQDWVNKRRSLGYSRLWWNWQLDKEHYENWDSMRQSLKADGVGILIYINPMLTDVEGKKKNYTLNLYKIAKQNKFFVELESGKNFQTSAFSDWTASIFDFNESKVQSISYYKSILREAIKSTGARGMMVDFGEAYPISSNNPITSTHNLYPVIYQKVVRQVLDQFKHLQIYTFSRSGYLNSPKYILSLWAGDQAMNFKKHSGLPSCLTAMLSSSLVGYSNTHCDIGGYTYYEILFMNTSVRSQILMTRWMQLGAFSPVFRTHEGNKPQNSVQVYSSDEIAKQFSFYSQIFHALSNYRKNQSKQSQKQKIPLIRPLFVQNQHIPEAYTISDQYYLGSNILVSPYLTEKQSRKIFVPKAKWINIWNGQEQDGCNCFIDHSDYFPLVLIKKQSQFREDLMLKVSVIVNKFKSILKHKQATIHNQL